MSFSKAHQAEVFISQPQLQRFLGLQALRIVAAVMVVLTHASFYTSERLDRSFATWERGTRGVDIFFVISGFVMVYSSQKLLKAADGWKRFAQHRLLRIVPLYWLMTTVKIAMMLSTAGLVLHAHLNPVTAVCSYLFLPARNLEGHIQPLVGVGWTLNFEIMFYLLFTLALFWRLAIFRFLGVALGLLSLGGLLRQPGWPAVSFYLNSIVLEFYFGMALAKLCQRGKFLPRWSLPWTFLLGFALLLSPPFVTPWPKWLISGLPAMLIVWAGASLGSAEKHIPKFVLYLGDASYAIYLIHPFVCPLAPNLLHRAHLDWPLLSVFVGAAFGLGVGCFLHTWIENPMTRVLKRGLRSREEIRAIPMMSPQGFDRVG